MQMERVFKDYGLPSVIRSDNGSPFASIGAGGLSALSVWWLKLGIGLERMAAGHPEQNGRHERLHRTLKQETARPPAANCQAQQQRFDRFRYEYNYERPHEALGQIPPARRYTGSPRAYPERLPEPSYGPPYSVRRVRSNGEINRAGRPPFLSDGLIGAPAVLAQTA